MATLRRGLSVLALALCLVRPEHAIGEAQATAEDGHEAVIASFHGGQVTVGDLERAIAGKDLRTRARIARHGPESFLQELIAYDLLVLEAERRGYGEHRAVREATKRAAVQAMFDRDLAVDPAAVAPDEVERYYEEHRERFVYPERRRATLIVADDKAEAIELRKQLAGKGRSAMTAAAREHSVDQDTARMGGELGYFHPDGRAERDTLPSVDAQLAKVAFALPEIGALSAPLERDGRHALLMLTGIKPGRHNDLEHASQGIRYALARDKHMQAREALVSELRASVKLAESLTSMLAHVDPAGGAASPARPAGASLAPRDPRTPAVAPPDEDDGS